MKAFLAGTDVTLAVPLTDADGNPMTVSAVSYRISDDAGTEVVPMTPLADFTEGDENAAITVPAANNALAAGISRALRSVELVCTVEGNTVMVSAAYVVQLSEVLEPGVNSFQTYAQAEFNALSVPNIPGWDAASREQRTAALIEARARIVQLNFSQLNSNMNWNQDSLNFVPEGSFQTLFAPTTGSSMFLFNGSLELMLPAQFKMMPPKFLKALNLAQIAEADVILGGDPVEARRQEGIIQDAVGESRQVFRAGKPLQLPCSRRALSYLSYFVTFAKKIGRH